MRGLEMDLHEYSDVEDSSSAPAWLCTDCLGQAASSGSCLIDFCAEALFIAGQVVLFLLSGAAVFAAGICYFIVCATSSRSAVSPRARKQAEEALAARRAEDAREQQELDELIAEREREYEEAVRQNALRATAANQALGNYALRSVSEKAEDQYLVARINGHNYERQQPIRDPIDVLLEQRRALDDLISHRNHVRATSESREAKRKSIHNLTLDISDLDAAIRRKWDDLRHIPPDDQGRLQRELGDIEADQKRLQHQLALAEAELQQLEADMFEVQL